MLFLKMALFRACIQFTFFCCAFFRLLSKQEYFLFDIDIGVVTLFPPF